MRYLLLALALSGCVSEERMRVYTNHYGNVHRRRVLTEVPHICHCQSQRIHHFACPSRRTYIIR